MQILEDSPDAPPQEEMLVHHHLSTSDKATKRLVWHPQVGTWAIIWTLVNALTGPMCVAWRLHVVVSQNMWWCPKTCGGVPKHVVVPRTCQTSGTQH